MKKTWPVRYLIQRAFFILILLIAVNHTLTEGGNAGIPFVPDASLHAVCPFGGAETLYTLISANTYIQKIHASSLVLFAIVAVLAVFFGPVFCGWICPLGTFQEWIGRIGRRIFKKKYNQFVPQKLDRSLRYLRYLVLVMVLYMTATSLKLAFLAVDPFHALFNFWSGEVALSALLVLGLTGILSLFLERPWCKYACPYGAILGVSNLFRLFAIRRNSESCIHCEACDRACPMNITVSTAEAVRNHQCISCMECTSEKSCPVIHTVELQVGAFKQEVKHEA